MVDGKNQNTSYKKNIVDRKNSRTSREKIQWIAKNGNTSCMKNIVDRKNSNTYTAKNHQPVAMLL